MSEWFTLHYISTSNYSHSHSQRIVVYRMKHSRDLNLVSVHFILFTRSSHARSTTPRFQGYPPATFFFSLSRISRISPPFPSPDFPAASAFFPGFSSTFLSSPSLPALNCPFPAFLLFLPFPFFGISLRFVSFRFVSFLGSIYRSRNTSRNPKLSNRKPVPHTPSGNDFHRPSPWHSHPNTKCKKGGRQAGHLLELFFLDHAHRLSLLEKAVKKSQAQQTAQGIIWDLEAA